MSKQTELPVQKSEILFLYESTYSVPNGDPFTGEQRYDEETKRVLVSDVRIKRYIRDYLAETHPPIYVVGDKVVTDDGTKSKTASSRFKELQAQFKGTPALDVVLKCIDVRLFGAVVAIKKDDKKKKAGEQKAEETENKKDEKAFNITGPVQFALLNPSLNRVDLRMHQNTSVFSSSEEKSQGAIGTTTVVPYSVNQIHGWINPYSAVHTGLKEDDISLMLKALWQSVNNANTRTKSNQNSLLLLQIVYSDATRKLYGIDRMIALKSEKQDEQIRSSDDYTLDFSKLQEKIQSDDVVKTVRFYTEHSSIKNALSLKKFEDMGKL